MELQEIWKVELEILSYIHNICIKNNLKYSLTYGSLIGIVRHGGFIPWDDDIDLMMLREDYEKLIKILKDQDSSEYLVQDYREISDYPNNFLKIRKNHTCYVQSKSEINKSYHKGIFIDIFPVDRKPNGIIESYLQKIAVMFNLLFSRSYPSDGSKWFIGIQNLLLKLGKNKRRAILLYTESIMTRWNSDSSLAIVLPCTIQSYNQDYDSDPMNEYLLMNFDGQEVLVIKSYDTFLTTVYGDYMKLPPESEQKLPHHPLCVSTSQNFEEIEHVER